MHRKLEIDPWKIIERGFAPSARRASESLFSIGNGAMGGRANFEERYSGDTLPGNYIGGIYYPDKTRVGWWKNGYPEYFAKVLNSACWIGINVTVDGEPLDLARCEVSDYSLELDMQCGLLTRRFTAQMPCSSRRVAVEARRFVSLARVELGAVEYKIKALDGDIQQLDIDAYVEGDVRNEDANYAEKFWEPAGLSEDSLTMRTLKTGFEVCWAQRSSLAKTAPSDDSSGHRQSPPVANPAGSAALAPASVTGAGERLSVKYSLPLAAGEEATLHKYVGVTSSLNHYSEKLRAAASTVAAEAAATGFSALLEEHASAWATKWQTADIQIEGDHKAQQGIRFCIFQLLQTYTGHDSRLNVGPKGFTGEKYGGSTYWDTEAYCLPFYLATCGEAVARQLLIYRHTQLGKAIENAARLGFTGGAALYPMVTMTGEECHNEWEITFEEIHRNGAIAYAIHNFCRYTGTDDYLASHGLEVLIAIARFWAQRATWSEPRGKYVILGVTGPNEYENNVNNNWYTNYIARWCLRYAAESLERVKERYVRDYHRIHELTRLHSDEPRHWLCIADEMYLTENELDTQGLFMQQDGYMDKEQLRADSIHASQRPINQHWSWDRILRSCFIKQADVLQGLYFFREHFDPATIRRNYEFYEPRTVHESSLSPCVHSILASFLGMDDKAYELYLRTARLDLDDYNREVHEGLHVTSMAGSWLSVVEGFGGVRVGKDGRLDVSPRLPEHWNALAFKLDYRGARLAFRVSESGVEAVSENGIGAEISIYGQTVKVGDQPVEVKR